MIGLGMKNENEMDLCNKGSWVSIPRIQDKADRTRSEWRSDVHLLILRA